MFTLEMLNTVFIRKSEAAKRLGLNNFQMTQLIVALKLETPKLAGASHLYTHDIDRLVGSPAVEKLKQIGTANLQALAASAQAQSTEA